MMKIIINIIKKQDINQKNKNIKGMKIKNI